MTYRKQSALSTESFKFFELSLSWCRYGDGYLFILVSTKMESSQGDKGLSSTERLLKLKRNPNKTMVIKLLVGYFQSMKLSHLLRANSPINTIRQVVKQQTTNEDGQPEEKSETIFRAALNMTDWMEHNPVHLTQVNFDRDRDALIIDALELAMGTKAFEI